MPGMIFKTLHPLWKKCLPHHHLIHHSQSAVVVWLLPAQDQFLANLQNLYHLRRIKPAVQQLGTVDKSTLIKREGSSPQAQWIQTKLLKPVSRKVLLCHEDYCEENKHKWKLIPAQGQLQCCQDCWFFSPHSRCVTVVKLTGIDFSYIKCWNYEIRP